MIDQPAPQPTPQSRPLSFWLAVGAVVVLVLVALMGLLRDSSRPLKPVRPGPTAVAVTLSSQPILVTFPELNERPFDFQNQRLRVSGSLTRFTPPACVPYSGPVFRWGLITDDLQMNASGFESLMRLVSTGTPMTVEGIWRLYSGPLGCGKGPVTDDVWYLQVERIIAPNPFPPTTAVPDQPGIPELTATPTFIPSPTPGGIPPTTVPAVTAAATSTTTSYPGAPTATLRPGETAVATATATTASGTTPYPGAPTATPRPDEATITPTSSATPDRNVTPSPTPQTGAGSTATPGSGFITATPGPTSTPGSGYPGNPTPFPTNTPGSGYPGD